MDSEYAWEWFQQAPGDDAEAKAERLVAAAEAAWQSNIVRRCDARVFWAMHRGESTAGIDSTIPDWDSSVAKCDVPIIRNTIRSICETEVSKVAGADSPKPKWRVTGGTFQQRQLAVLLNSICDAIYDAPCGRYATQSEMYRDGQRIAEVATGSAALVCWQHKGKVHTDLDDTLSFGYWSECELGAKFAVVRRKKFDPSALIGIFPEFEADILKNAVGDDDSDNITPDEQAQQWRPAIVWLYQGWRVATDHTPGVELFCLSDGTVLRFDDEFPDKELPVAQFDVNPARGDFGCPTSLLVYPATVLENRSIHRIAKSVYDGSEQVFAYVRALICDEAQVQTREGVKFIAIKGMNVDEAIKQLSPKSINQDSLTFVELMRMAAHETAGVDEGDTSGRGAAGATSGRHEAFIAKRHPERHADKTRRYVEWVTNRSARVQMCAYARAAREADDAVMLGYRVGQEYREIDLRQLDLDGLDRFTIEVSAVSEEADGPAQILDEAQRFYERGEISAEKLLDMQLYYDRERLSPLGQQANRWLQAQITRWLIAPEEELLDVDIVKGPVKYFTVDTLRSLLEECAGEHTQAMLDKVPEERLTLFRRFMDLTQSLIDAHERREAELAAIRMGVPGGG